MKACPTTITLVVRSRFSPRMGRSRAFRRPWSVSSGLLAWTPVSWKAAGSRSSMIRGYARYRSVVTSTGELRRKALNPPVHRDVVDLDAALGEELFDVPVGEAEAQVPADRQGDDLGREAVPGEG